jgi:SpoVK/Ycf46/Vps4 family AAA+-type ATPase
MFAKRTEIKKSTDRSSNMEINLLLQLVESYDGITICTTNLKKSIDPAFERRLAFVVHFPKPEKELHLALWRHHLPTSAPLDDDLEEGLLFIAEAYELTGGSMRSVVLRAAYQAAIESVAINERLLSDAARQEYKALRKLLRETW